MKEATHIDPALVKKILNSSAFPQKERLTIQDISLLLYLGEEGFAELKRQLKK